MYPHNTSKQLRFLFSSYTHGQVGSDPSRAPKALTFAFIAITPFYLVSWRMPYNLSIPLVSPPRRIFIAIYAPPPSRLCEPYIFGELYMSASLMKTMELFLSHGMDFFLLQLAAK